MPRLNFNVSLVGKTPEQIKDLIEGLKKLGITKMGCGHNNANAWIVWTQEDISELLKQKGFKFLDNRY